MKHRLFGVAALGAVLVFGVQTSRAAGSQQDSPTAKPLGIVPARTIPVDNRRRARPARVANLLYRGGSVQTGVHHTYAIYWGAPATFSDSAYQTTINQYFTDVAAASGSTNSVYFSDTQYYQLVGGVKTSITYGESFDGHWADTTNPTSRGCSSNDGGTVSCMSDRQIELEVQKAITANSWVDGQGSEFFVFLGKGISTCAGNSCFVKDFCAYHSSFTDKAGHAALYANMPYTGYSQWACGSGQSPSGDADADSTLNVTSHEANETITDPQGTAWYDSSGNENGDKCAWKFGTLLGSNTNGGYNQVINGHDYFLQGEWSNHSNRCVWSGI